MSRAAATGSIWTRAQLEQILSALPDAVIVQDATGSVVFANDPALEMIGADPAEGMDGRVADLLRQFEAFDEQGVGFPLDNLPNRRALQGERHVDFVVRFHPIAGGEDRWVEISSQPVFGAGGGVEFAVNTLRDITDEHAKEEQRRFQAKLLDEVDAAIVATDIEGAVTYHNRIADDLFGWDRGQAARLNLGEVLVPLPDLATTPTERDHVDTTTLGDVNETEEAADPAALADATHTEPSPANPFSAALAHGRWEGEVGVAVAAGDTRAMYAAVSATRDTIGEVIGVSVVLFDLADRRRTEAELRMSERRYRILAESLPHIVWTARPDGLIDHYNDRFVKYTGVRARAGTGWGWIDMVHPDEVPGLTQQWTKAVETGKELETEFRLRRADGAYRWHMGRAIPLRDDSEAVVAWIGTATDIDDRKRAERSVAFLAEASEVLGNSLDYAETLAAVARLAVPRMADWCRVDLLDPDGELQMVTVAHVDEKKVALAREVNERWPADLNAPTGLAAVLRTGRSDLIEEISESMFENAAADPELVAILRELGIHSSMTVPLLADGRAIGAISFVAAESGRRFDRTDLALAEDLARRATVAIENALLYARVSQFKGAVDNSTDCVFMYDPDTLRFSYVNRGAVEQVGYSTEELLRMTPLDLKPEFSEETYREMIAPLISGEMTSRSFETVQRRKDGVLIPVDVVLQRIPIEPEGLGVIAFVRDVTERVETQARLRRLAQAERTRAAELDAVIRAMGEAVIVFDADGLVTLSNPAADSLFADALVSRWDDVLGQFEPPGGRALTLKSDEQQGPVELRMHGRRRWVEMTAYPVVVVEPAADAHPGTNSVTILVMRDITAQREDDAMREAFVGVLSHELRTPVTTIYGSSKVLQRAESRLPEAARRDIYKDIAEESERLYRLVEDLLVLARFGDEPLTLGDEPVLLQRILPAAVASEQNRWPATEFVTEIPPGLPTVRAEPTYVEQVARNLLSNAAKYGPAGGSVTMTLEQRGDEILTIVRDSGPGFPQEEGERLFELFYRSPLTATSAPGAGIGLFVCRRLIEAMGGRIWARNLPDGAEFGFALQRFTEED